MTTTADFLSARPRLRPDAVLGAAQHRGPVRVHLVRILDSGRSLEVGAKEHFVLARLDGTRSLAEIGADYQREFGKELGPANWGQILGTLHGRGLLAGDTPLTPAPAAATGPPTAEARPGAALFGRAIPLVRRPGPLLDALLRRVRIALSRPVVAMLLAAVVAMEILLVTRLGELTGQAMHIFELPGPLLLVSMLTWVAAALHELAHGVVARRYGVPVLEIGVRWVPPLVLPYCRTDGYLYLPRRRAHLAIAGSGVLVELALLLPLFAWWWWRDPGGDLGIGLAALLLFGSAHALLNLVPVPPLDGYQMLGHSLGVADLSRQSATYVVLLLRRDPLVAGYPRWLRATYLGYALVALAVVVGVLVLVLLATHAWLDSWPLAAGVVAAALGLAVGGAVGARRRATRRRLVDDPARPRLRFGVVPAASAALQRRQTDGTPGQPGVPSPAPSTARESEAVPGPAVRTAAPVPTTSGPALSLRAVVKSYDGRRVVDGVTLEVGAGEFFGLLGPNGAGKTTLVEIAVGLRHPDEGGVSVLGGAPWPRNTAVLRRVGVQTQNAAFFVRQTAREHLRTVAALYGLGPDAAEEAVRLVGLTEVADTRAERLSGGQQQRLAIATALVHDPELVFLDEPTASLDPQARRELWAVLRSLHAAGRTVVYTTHHLDEAEALCDRVAIMARGSVVALGAPYRLIEDAALPTRLVVPRSVISPDVAGSLPGVAAASLEGPSVVIETHDSPAVLAELGAYVGPHGVQTRTPTLEDVYLDCIEPTTERGQHS